MGLYTNTCPSLITNFNCCAGAEQMCNAVEEITGHRPWILYKLCWRYFTPLLSMVRCTQQKSSILLTNHYHFITDTQRYFQYPHLSKLMTVSQICIRVIPVVLGVMIPCAYCKQVSDNLTSLPLAINIKYQFLIIFAQL